MTLLSAEHSPTFSNVLTEEWILEIATPITPADKWLRYLGGDWGPDHGTTARLHEAMRFDSHEEALGYIRDRRPWSREPNSLIPRRVRVNLEVVLP